MRKRQLQTQMLKQMHKRAAKNAGKKGGGETYEGHEMQNRRSEGKEGGWMRGIMKGGGGGG